MPSLKSLKNKYLTTSDGDVLGVTTNTENISALSFKLATADSLNVFNMVDGFTDDYNDATGVDAAASTKDFRSTDGYYRGGVAGDATGGTITTYSSGGNDYKVHSFLSGATNFVLPGAGSVDLLIVAGGGGGGQRGGGASGSGGGAGGVRQLASTSMIAGTWVATVGAGGAMSANGANSTMVLGGTSYSATGGGAGNVRPSQAAQSGGSGGGSNTSGANGPGNAGGYTPPEGYEGNWISDSGYNGGGGGGAGAAPGGANTSNGGVGIQNDYRTGSNVYYGGGGGGGQGGSGGSGGGGPGGTNGGTAGSVNTGGGGGGTKWDQGNSAAGGSGIIVARYITGSLVTFEDMILQSDAFTAQAAPTTSRIILDELTAAGGTTLNTDLKAYASRNNGTTFTQITLADQGYLNPNSGIDGYTKLMLHCDGSNSGTTFTDSSFSGHTVTANGNAVTDTTYKKFGTAGYKCPATGDFLSIADSDDWNFGSDPFTIDCWLYRTGASSYQTIVSDKTDNSNYWQWRYFGGSGNFDFNVTGAGAFSVNWTVSAFAQDTWVHHQIVRNGSSWYLFQNGTQVGGTQTQAGAIPDMTGVMEIQGGSWLGQPFIGYMDEFRISKGVARNTSNFTVPSGEYVQSRRLLSGSVDISGQPSGTDIKYKIETLNQSASKETRIYGTSMAWA